MSWRAIEGTFVFLLVIFILIAAALDYDRKREPELLITPASASSCAPPRQRLENPCDRINCHRPDTRKIA